MKVFAVLFVLVLLVWTTTAFAPKTVLAAGAATIDLSGVEQIGVGEGFEVFITINPNNESLDTVRVNLSFPADLVQVDHFILGDLFPRASPGNSVDNIVGIISEGGFNLSGPVNNNGAFGVVTFTAIKAGSASIKVLETSRLISGGEEKIDLNELEQIAVTISEPAVEAAEAATVAISSLSHPDQNQWYNLNSATFSWTTSDSVEGYEMAFDQDIDTEPSKEIVSTSVTIKDIVDGVWYLHFQGKLADGKETEVVHYKVMIDTVVPNKFEPQLDKEQLSEGENLTISFGTTDELSGMAKYEISVNGGEFEEKTSPVIIENLKAGDYLAEVKALDKAGNKIYGRAVARVYPAGVELPPVIAAIPVVEEKFPAEAQGLQEEKVAWWGAVAGGLALVLIVLFIFMKRKNLKK